MLRRRVDGEEDIVQVWEELRHVANCGLYEETSVLVCSGATACSLTGLLDVLVTNM